MEIDDFFPEHFTHKVVTHEIISNENFSGKYRLSIKSIEDFKKWLSAFEEKTNTTWILKRSLSSDEHSTYIVNRSYVCQHSSFRKRKKDNGSLQVKDKNCMASFTIKVKKSTRHTRYTDPYVQEGLHGILNINFKHSHLVNNAEAWTWLKRSEETKKIFLEYFSRGMSPSIAIKHHESILRMEHPELLANSRKNPPKAWVYTLHESFKENESNMLLDYEKSHKQKKLKQKTEKSDSLAENFTSHKNDQNMHHQDQHIPCIIHMKNKVNNDYDDLKYLKIPNEVKNLFYKYFDDGLNVSEAIWLNEKNVKKDKSLPQFIPSLRLVNFIYNNWCRQKRSDNSTCSNTDISSIDNISSYSCVVKDGNLSVQTIAENVKNMPNSSGIIIKSVDEECASQLEENYSFETYKIFVPILPHLSSSKIVTNSLVIDKDLISKSTPIAVKSTLYTNNISDSPIVYLFDPKQNQLIAINTPSVENSIIHNVTSYAGSFTSYDLNNMHISSAKKLEGESSAETNSLPLSDKENISNSITRSNISENISGFLGESNEASSELSISSCQTLFLDSFNETESNLESQNQNIFILQSNILDDSNSFFEMNSKSSKNEANDFKHV